MFPPTVRRTFLATFDPKINSTPVVIVPLPLDVGGKDPTASSLGAMVFSKLMGKSPGGKETEEEDDDDEDLEDVTAATSAVPGKTWENLLNWTPEYTLLAGVFRDIAELPHNLQLAAAAGEAQPDVAADPVIMASMPPPVPPGGIRGGQRPAPVGLDRQFGGGDANAEEYI